VKETETKFFLHENYLNELKNLPWRLELENWEERGIKFLDIRKGISRHPVKFLQTRYSAFAIKQTTASLAECEISGYQKLLSLGIHTLVPIGYVVTQKDPRAVQTKASISRNKNELAFTITLLEDKALPDSYLYRLNFKEKNLEIIWDAIAELMAVLHFNNIYWGDASLGNALVRFFKIKDEKGRVRTELKAILADAETIKVFTKIPIKKRTEDLQYFFDSMYWLNEDYKQTGDSRKNFTTSGDKKYILQKYKEEYFRLKKIASFEKLTGINVRRHFHQVHDIHGLDSIKKQIEEHKWYLSEKAGKEIGIKKSSESWLNEIYYPIINEFEKLDIFEYFPFTDSVKLYVDVMTHKYYLSQEAKKDVGVERAIKSYYMKYGGDKSLIPGITTIFKTIKKLFY